MEAHRPDRNLDKKLDLGGKIRSLRLEIDKTLFALIIILLVFGIIMMFSASYAAAMAEYGDGYYYVKNQTLCACIGLVAMFVASYLDYNFFNNTIPSFANIALSHPFWENSPTFLTYKFRINFSQKS